MVLQTTSSAYVATTIIVFLATYFKTFFGYAYMFTWVAVYKRGSLDCVFLFCVLS